MNVDLAACSQKLAAKKTRPENGPGINHFSMAVLVFSDQHLRISLADC